MTHLSRAEPHPGLLTSRQYIFSHSLSHACIISIGVTVDFLKIHSNSFLDFLIFSSFIITYIHLFFRGDYFILFKSVLKNCFPLNFSPDFSQWFFSLWTDFPRQWNSKILISTSRALQSGQEGTVIGWALLWPSVPLYRVRCLGDQRAR